MNSFVMIINPFASVVFSDTGSAFPFLNTPIVANGRPFPSLSLTEILNK